MIFLIRDIIVERQMPYSIWIIFIFILFSCKDENNSTEESNKTISATNKFDQDWMNFKYDRVIAFATVDPFLIIPQTRTKIDLSNIKDTISVTLSKSQISLLDSVVNGKSKIVENERIPADCFNPRHNIIFLQQDSIVHFISVCYECGNYNSSKKGIKGGLESFKYFFNQLGLKVFNRPDYHSHYYDSIITHRKNVR